MKSPNPPIPPSDSLSAGEDLQATRGDDTPRMGPDSHQRDDPGPEPRTTAFEGPSCESCGRRLTGRKRRFCSDRCRMRDSRHGQQRRRLDLLKTIGAALEALREELVGEVKP